MKIKQKTLSDKINEIIAKGNESSSDESATEASAPRIAEFDEDEYELPQAQTTEFRKRNVKLLSEQSAKYRGKIASRSDFLEEEADDSSADEDADDDDVDFEASDSEDEAIAAFGRQLKKSEQKLPKILAPKEEEDGESEFDSNAEDDESVSDEEEGDGDNDSEEEEFDDDNDSEEEEDDESDESEDEEEHDNEKSVGGPMISESNRQAEIRKGVCVQNQLHLWERLLELRINAQKMMTKANQLPPPEEFQQVPDIEDAKLETTSQVATLLSKLCELQYALSVQYPELRAQVKSGQKRQATEADKEAPPSKRYGTELEQNFKLFRTYRDNVLLKWDDRTRLLAPGAGIKRKSAQEDYDILKKITHALSNRQALIQRSQVRKEKQGENTETAQTQTHIYDDSDFYHQQLRELIEYKANSTANMSEVTRQYVELQKLRQKMKKKVDTRASKGRKMRCVPYF